MQFNIIGIVGAGVMGGGIAQFFAERGRHVRLWDANPNALWGGIGAVHGRLKKSAEKGAISPRSRWAEIMIAPDRRWRGLDAFARCGPGD